MSNYNCLTMMILRKCRANYEELTSLINNEISGRDLMLRVNGEKNRTVSGGVTRNCKLFRIRMCIWKQWKLLKTKMRKLRGMGVESHYVARIACDCKGY